MLPLLAHLFHAFFLDELAFRRWIRGGMLAFAGSGFAFADQLAALLHAPTAVTTIKVIAVACGFIAGAIQSSAKRSAADLEPAPREPVNNPHQPFP